MVRGVKKGEEGRERSEDEKVPYACPYFFSFSKRTLASTIKKMATTIAIKLFISFFSTLDARISHNRKSVVSNRPVLQNLAIDMERKKVEKPLKQEKE